MILVNENNNDIILINSRLKIHQGMTFILFVKLDDINVGIPPKLYSKFEETILREYRLATIKEVEVYVKTKICNLLKILTPKDI